MNGDVGKVKIFEKVLGDLHPEDRNVPVVHEDLSMESTTKLPKSGLFQHHLRVIGIDPGINHTGWAILEKQRDGSAKYIASGRISTTPNDVVTKRLYQIFNSLDQIISEYNPDLSSVEQIFINSNAKTSLILGFARGAILACLGKDNITTSEFAPNAIKKTIVGNGKAGKDQVMKMLRYVIPNVKFDSEDEADAIAIAYTGLIYSTNKLS